MMPALDDFNKVGPTGNQYGDLVWDTGGGVGPALGGSNPPAMPVPTGTAKTTITTTATTGTVPTVLSAFGQIQQWAMAHKAISIAVVGLVLYLLVGRGKR